MATESTAIVNLLDLVKKKPIEKDDADDMLFGGRVRFDAMAMPAPAHPVMLPQLPQPSARQPSPALDGKTHRVMRAPASSLPKKLAVPVGLFVVTMVLLSVYLAKGDKHAVGPKTTVVHAPQPTVTTLMPESAPPPAPAPDPAPVAAAVAPAAAAAVTPIQQPTVTEIPAEAAAQPTVPAVEATVPTVPTVPTVTDEVAADETPVAKPSKHRKHAAAKRAKPSKRVAAADNDEVDSGIAKLAKAAKAPKAEKPEKSENLGGKGALQISSSPARVVWVDGKDTKSMTPQKVTLAPGTHNITLFDKKTRSAKTFQVEIKPNQTTRISKSY